MTQEAWERAMGMSGYRGSPAEKNDRKDGIKVGGTVEWRVWPENLVGKITEMKIDEDGDPWFLLQFDEHKDVWAQREEIALHRKG